MSEHIYGSVKCERIPEYRLERREEIVRCRDCVCFEDCGKFGQWCTQLDFGKKEIANGYCAWGKRKVSGDD